MGALPSAAAGECAIKQEPSSSSGCMMILLFAVNGLAVPLVCRLMPPLV